MKNRDKIKGFERQSKTGNPKETERNYEKKPFASNILMLLFSLSKSKGTRQERTAKKQGRPQNNETTRKEKKTKKTKKKKKKQEK